MMCPFLTRCRAKVKAEHYFTFCVNTLEDKYKECPYYKKLAEEMHTPSEWSMLFLRRASGKQ